MNTQVPTVLKNTSGLSSSGVGRPAGGARTFCSSFRETAQSLTLVPSLLQIPLSRKVHGVNAIGAEVESHAPLRHAGRVSRMTIRRMQSTSHFRLLWREVTRNPLTLVPVKPGWNNTSVQA